MKQERLIDTAKKLDRLLKVIQIVNCAAMVIAMFGVLILGIAYWTNPENVNVQEKVTVSMGEFSMEIANIEMGIDLGYAWANCALCAVLLIALCVGFHYVRKIMVPMMEGNPFDSSVSEYLKKLSLITLVYGIVGNIGSSLMTHMKMNHYQLEQLVDGQRIFAVTPEYGWKLGFVIVFFAFLLASYIFRYGAELQQLSDETL